VAKTGDGLEALQWFREGRLLKVAEYCCYDVKITKLVHEYGLAHHRLHYTDRYGKVLTVPVSW
jgi:DEAD/DEAH box helicase domain-containing protein